MSTNFIIRMPGGVCYAHGPYQSWNCPKLGSCNTDPKHVDYMELAGCSEEEIIRILDCYCVCHSPFASVSYCEHCKGDNEVGNTYKERERLRDEVMKQAKALFGSIDRDDIKPLLDAVGELLLHEHGLTK